MRYDGTIIKPEKYLTRFYKSLAKTLIPPLAEEKRSPPSRLNLAEQRERRASRKDKSFFGKDSIKILSGEELGPKDILMEVRTSDLYEAAYYLERGCRLEAVEKVKLDGGRIDCVFVIQAQESPLTFLMARWSRGNTEVNLHAFRSAYAQVSGYAHRARKSSRMRMSTGGEA